MTIAKLLCATILSATGLVYAGAAAAQQSVAEFYKGKTVSIVVSTGAGGGYDVLARAIARNLPKHLPGAPAMIVQNMPGGGHMLAANHIYTIAPKDGTVIAALNQNVPSNQVLAGENSGARYDANKFIWLGRFAEKGNPALAVWHTAPVKTLFDARTTEIIVGATGEGSSSYRYTTAMNHVFGTKFKIIKGYKTVPELLLAIDRGEIQGRTGALSAYEEGKPEWLKEKKLRFLVQVGYTRDDYLKDVPVWTELAETEEQKQILNLYDLGGRFGRPWVTGATVPAERIAALRTAFMKSLNDPELQKEIIARGLEISPMSGEEVQKLVAEVYAMPPELLKKTRVALGYE